MRVLVLTAYYPPAFRAGGPLRTLVNLIEALGSEVEFRVITRDRDLGDQTAFAGISPGRWIAVGKAFVCYCGPRELSPRAMARLLSGTPHDTLYLNSLFDPRFSILPLVLRSLGLLPPARLVLAPRGESSPAALSIRSAKKRAYLAAAGMLGLHRDVVWQASSEFEAEDIRRLFGRSRNVVTAPDLPSAPSGSATALRAPKRAGALRATFLGRISPMKNLHYAIDLFQAVRGEVRLQIAGPIESAAYWAQCRAALERLPPSVSVDVLGAVDPSRVGELLGGSELLLLPSLGENFGHVVYEALAMGCPAMVSDRTPWRDLHERGAGWVLPLERPDLFSAALQEAVDMAAGAHEQMSCAASSYAAQWLVASDLRARSFDVLTGAVFAAAQPSAQDGPPR